MELKGKKTALVLSGGGAKGAYHIGMLRALEEAGLEKDKLTIAGTSIGALNGVIYAASDTDRIREMIRALGNADNTAVFMDTFYPDELLGAIRIPVGVCAYCLETERPEYFWLTGLPAKEQRDLTLASASLPDILSPMEYKGRHYLDGGLIPPQCSPLAAAADKIPLRMIRERDEKYDLIIIGYLKPEDQVDITWVRPGTEVLECRPSEPLEYTPGTGTRDYSERRLRKNERLGYEDTLRLLGSF